MRNPLLLLPLILLAALIPRTPERAVILWAWERPEDLSFINPEKVGVAFLAKTIYLRGDKVVVKPRLQPLKLAPGTKLVAVVRIETDRSETPDLSPVQLQRTVKEISVLSGISVVQIDFDATVSERTFYRLLLTEVRRELPRSIKLSITALASWCAGDDWLRDVPVDEAVPMLFRMGVEKNVFQRRLDQRQQFESSICRSTAGVSVDEPVNVPPVDRLYIFNSERWTEASFARAMEVYQR